MRTTDIRRNAFHESKGICLSLKERKEEIMKELKISYRTRCIEWKKDPYKTGWSQNNNNKEEIGKNMLTGWALRQFQIIS